MSVNVAIDVDTSRRTNTAVVYCEASLGTMDGKTANGLVRHSELYEIVSVIDSEKAGLDAGQVLDGTPNGIPIRTDLAAAIAAAAPPPTSSSSGWLPQAACSPSWREASSSKPWPAA
jgi:uncharacterized NAD-dependent epimerase/dehydratase family protein